MPRSSNLDRIIMSGNEPEPGYNALNDGLVEQASPMQNYLNQRLAEGYVMRQPGEKKLRPPPEILNELGKFFVRQAKDIYNEISLPGRVWRGDPYSMEEATLFNVGQLLGAKPGGLPEGAVGAGVYAGGKARTAKGAGKWWKGADDKMRFEIDDRKAYKTIKFPEGYTMDPDNISNLVYLEDVISHPELFKAYPQLKEMPVVIDPTMTKSTGALVEYNDLAGGPAIKINPELPDSKETLIHEIQHAVQEIEGFARGGSPDSPVKFGIHPHALKQMQDELKDLNRKVNTAKTQAEYEKWYKKRNELDEFIRENTKTDTDRFLEYRNLPGEVEAREVGRRAVR